MEILTVEKLKEMQPHSVIKKGTIKIEDYWDSSKEMEVDFVAVRGYIEDWTIYHLILGSASFDQIMNYGDKIYNINSIRTCVPCNDEALKLYRR